MNLAFLHTSNLIFSCIQKQGKVSRCMGSEEYRGSFFGSQKPFKMGKAENGEQYCSATTQHHNTTISQSLECERSACHSFISICLFFFEIEKY